MLASHGCGGNTVYIYSKSKPPIIRHIIYCNWTAVSSGWNNNIMMAVQDSACLGVAMNDITTLQHNLYNHSLGMPVLYGDESDIREQSEITY